MNCHIVKGDILAVVYLGSGHDKDFNLTPLLCASLVIDLFGILDTSSHFRRPEEVDKTQTDLGPGYGTTRKKPRWRWIKHKQIWDQAMAQQERNKEGHSADAFIQSSSSYLLSKHPLVLHEIYIVDSWDKHIHSQVGSKLPSS